MSLKTLLDSLKNVRVLVIGDMMLDHYIWGDVHRISPEAPVPVVHAEHDTYTAGGAANVSLNLANLGVKTSLLGQFTRDDAGNRLINILSDHKVKVIFNDSHSLAPTIIKTRVIVRNQQLCRIDREGSPATYNIHSEWLFDDLLNDVLDEVDAVIISDYAKGVITQPLVDKLLAYASNHPKLLIAVDPKPSRELSISGAGLLTPNRQEALQLAGIPEPRPKIDFPLEEVCSRIYDLYNPKLLVVTLGADGMAVCEGGKIMRQLPTEAKEVYDVSGAGDTVISTLTAALAAGAHIIEAAKLANAAAACVVSHIGTAPILLNELSDRLKVIV